MVSGPDGNADAVTESDPVTAAQSRAAHAYANTLLTPEVATPAAEDAIAAFRQALGARREADGPLNAPAANDTLLALTRLMTAVSMADRSSPEDRRQAVWASIGSASHCTCRESAALLATRANGNIQPRENAALDEHLATCADCRQLAVASVAADSAFSAELTPPAGGGGFSVPSTVGAYAAVAVLVAAGIGVFALTSGGSSSGSSHTAAVLAVQTQTSTNVDLPITTATAPPAVHHAGAAPLHRHHSTVTHTTTTPQTSTSAQTTTRMPATTRTPSASSASGATPAATASATPASSSASAASPASTGASSAGAGQATAPSSAAVVSGQSSLPAESAPQQGIGSATTTTP